MSLLYTRSYTKFGPDRFSHFDVYWLQTNKQTDRHPDKPNLYIDWLLYIFFFGFAERNFLNILTNIFTVQVKTWMTDLMILN